MLSQGGSRGVGPAGKDLPIPPPTEDDWKPRVIVLPIPVPVFVPVPMNMYCQKVPVPFSMPVPVSTTSLSLRGIRLLPCPAAP